MRNRFLLCHPCLCCQGAANWRDHKETTIQMFSCQNVFSCPWTNTVIRRAVVPAGVHTLMCTLLLRRSTDLSIYRYFQSFISDRVWYLVPGRTEFFYNMCCILLLPRKGKALWSLERSNEKSDAVDVGLSLCWCTLLCHQGTSPQSG